MTIVEKATELRAQIKAEAAQYDDAKALTRMLWYDVWHEDRAYAAGDRVRYNDILYKVLIAHTSQASWTPDVSPSLFAKVLIPDPEVIPEWEQPDSTNPYMQGDKVTHNGQTWISDINNNVWEPGVYGWTVTE